jgi:hypothetical protein
VSEASVSITVPGRASEVEALWYDPHRWPSWIDGFGHVVSLDADWPQEGARLIWDSPPGGRGRVVERVTAYEARTGQTLAVEDEKLTGSQRVAFTPGTDETEVTLSLEYELKERAPLTWLVDAVFIRRAMRDSLRRTLTRFAYERRAEIELS